MNARRPRVYFCVVASDYELMEIECNRYRAALAELVRLKDGPRDDAYRAQKDVAWERARGCLREHPAAFDADECAETAQNHERTP